MSCSICGQDVPVVPTAEDAEIVTCMQCRAKFVWTATQRSTFRLDQRHGPAVSTSVTALPHAERPPTVADNDDWDEVFQPGDRWSLGVPGSTGPTYRHDRVDVDAQNHARGSRTRRQRSHWLQWTILSLGVALFSCGATLVAWSFGDDHHHLWNIGAPMALAGQAAFLIGLVLQLEVIWQQSKLTSRRLENLDQRVSPFSSSALTTTPQALDAGSSGIGQAPPPDAESLFKELKGQLDHMATRLMRRKW